ncbi:hypothetical protein ZIOFF_059261 [Zingiber officinale]|uniref:NAC domain-containing protein n=1 Tax=Zingiber officinale TaxID=94328 RepID=A0A8J5KMI6_ZINOF|nr:hypothetical protein ZIOFF_059261 [Zingiber officinale]
MSRTRDAEAELNLPPGFRFHPTDEELVVHYLCRKAAGQCQPVPIIAEIDLYKFDPWELPAKALFGKKEWYFFTPRERKYPNGSRPNRSAGTGYWKATGADKPISPKGSSATAGIKKALVFYSGKAPQGVKTDWIMHEYRLADAKRGHNKGSLRLDDWVLCRLYNKKNTWEKMQLEEKSSFVETMDLAYDTVSDSFRTAESDVENDSVLPNISDLFGTTQAATGPQQALSTCNEDGLQMVHRCQKEDSEWFMDLKLEDLQTSCMSFGLPVPHYGRSQPRS